MNGLELVFLGHQSWLARAGDVSVLIDPILLDAMGHHTRLPVHPPRTIDVAALGPIDLVVLTHGHNDHVDLPSLARLPHTVPVLVAPLMPAVVVRAIQRLGLEVHRACPGEALAAGPLAIELLPGAASAPVGEERVAQVWLSVAHSAGDSTVLVGVDTPISRTTLQRFERGELAPPALVVVANNTQLPPAGVWGSGTDLLRAHPSRAFSGLDLLRTLCVDYVSGLPSRPTVALCGGGFLDAHELGVPYLHDDAVALARLARELGVGRPVVAPIPGGRLAVRGGAVEVVPGVDPAITPHLSVLQRRRDRVVAPGKRPLRPVLPPLPAAERVLATARIDRFLAELAPLLLASPLGRAVAGCSEHRGRWCGPRRLLVRLVSGAGPSESTAVCRALDLVESRFVHVENIVEETILDDWPFGFEVGLADLDAWISGRLVVWDVLGVALHHWSAAGDGIPAFLCAAMGESVRPAATAAALAAQLCALGVPTQPGDLVGGAAEKPI